MTIDPEHPDHPWFTEIEPSGSCAFALRTTGEPERTRSAYQEIEIHQTRDWGKLMVIDGCTMLSSRDNFLYHEMMAHPVLYTHPHPARVAIIGGGDCGTLREVLRHPEVQQVVQIDIDEQVTRAAERHFPELCEANGDPRATLLFDDGIRWISEAAPGSLDVIIVDSTDPVGPGEVLFTTAFYGACLQALAEGGLIVQQSESPLLHMEILERMHHRLWDAACSDVQTLFFPQPIYPSGWWSATLGRKGGRIEGFREQDVAARTFETQYYNAEIHRAAFAQPEFFRRAAASWRPVGS